MTLELKFDLVEEQHEALNAIKGSERLFALREIDQTCRAYLKHGHPFGDNPDRAIEAIRSSIMDLVPDLDD